VKIQITRPRKFSCGADGKVPFALGKSGADGIVAVVKDQAEQ